ncbi:MAG: MATE family efflux transporter [Mycoplasmatales bacterium]|nr:MATE family efflux transporter [Mycoplasmatales bacterium]
MKTQLLKHLPSTKEKWKFYFKLFYPMILGSSLFALNGFVDNFMVGHIAQGTAALSAVNSWTGIIIGFYVGISASGSISMAKYYFAGDYEKARDVFRFRMLFSLFFALFFTILMLSIPEMMISVFLKKHTGLSMTQEQIFLDQENYSIALDNAKSYARIITIQWILMAISYNLGNPLREIGHGKVTMIWGVGTLSANIILNSTLMYGFHLGVSGAAWASVAGRIVAIIWGTSYIILKKIQIRFNFLTIYKIKKQAIKDFFRNWFMFASFSTTIIFIILRNYFYDAGYTVSSNTIGQGVGAMSVLALTGAIGNVFTTTFSSLASMSANVVGSELGKGNIKQAKINAFELKGFVTLMSIFMSILLIIFASFIPFMDFLSKSQYTKDGKLLFDSHAQLSSVRNSTYVIAIFYPSWIWFSASYRIAASADKGKWFAFIDWFTSGPIQLAWVAIIMLGIVPNSEFLQENFWLSYSIFFLSDLIKLIGIEILFSKLKWDKTISKEKLAEEKVIGEDEIRSGNHI